jgi:hypothetical protein
LECKVIRSKYDDEAKNIIIGTPEITSVLTDILMLNDTMGEAVSIWTGKSYSAIKAIQTSDYIRGLKKDFKGEDEVSFPYEKSHAVSMNRL